MMLHIPQLAQPAMQTVNDIDAQCAVCVFVCVCVGVSASASQVKVTKKYVCVYVNEPPTCCPRLPFFQSPSLSLFLPYNASSSAAAYLKIRSILFGLVVPPSLSITTTLPLGRRTIRCLSRAAFSTAQQIEFPS